MNTFLWFTRIIVFSSQFWLTVFTGSFLDSTSPLLAIAACTALGEIGRNGPLPIPSEGSGFTKQHLVESLLNRIPSSKETNKVSLFVFSFLSEIYIWIVIRMALQLEEDLMWKGMRAKSRWVRDDLCLTSVCAPSDLVTPM